MLININTSRDFVDQFPRNLLANLIYFVANIVVGIVLVPYFISNLGIAAYGLIPLAASITGYVVIAIQSLNTAVSRFLTMDLQREDYAAANRTFNTALIGLSAVILLTTPIVFVVAWLVPSIFHVPAGQESDTILLFIGTAAAFLIRAWTGNFTVQLFAYNRLDLQNFINLVNLFVQTAMIVLLFRLFGANLALVGGAYIIGALAASSISIILARQLCPYLNVSIHSFDCSKIKDLCEMAWWIIINQIGTLLFLSVDIVVVNLLFGATSAGEYAIVLQWAILLRSIAGMSSGVLTPTILSYYAHGQTMSLIHITKTAVKLMGYAMALPIGLICGFASQLLTVWVGPQFTFLAPLMIILTVHLSVNLTVLPLFSINVAYNRVRVPGVVTLVMGIGNVVLAIALPLLTGWGYYGVAIAGAMVLTIKNAIFTPWYATKVLGLKKHTFAKSMLPGMVASILLWILSNALESFLSLTILSYIIAIGGLIVIYIGVVWIFGLSTFERKIFESYISKNLSRGFKYHKNNSNL